MSKANVKSDKLVLNARRAALSDMFDQLDTDKDGEISSTNIDLSTVPPSLLTAFRPLFQELQQLNQPLDKDEFVDAATRLYETLSQNEKNQVLKFSKNTEVFDPIK